MPTRDFTTHPLVLRELTVTRTAQVTPRMRRITLSGAQLGPFRRNGWPMPAFAAPGFDDHVKLVFATDGDLAAALPVQREHSIDWPPAPHRAGRDYTPRRHDPVTGELDLDFVLHGTGPAASWAASATVGDTVHVVGPKASAVLPDDVAWVLLAGDETALPAIGRFLDERPLDVPVQVVVEVGDPAARQELPLRESDTLRFVGTTPGLAQALRELDWPAGPVYAWCAGESRALLPVRRWLARDRQVPKSHLSVTGYWHAAVEESGAGAGAPRTSLDPVPWFATRAALQLGLLDAVADAPASVASLAARTGGEPRGVATLLEYLATVEVVRVSGDVVELGPLGLEVVADDHRREELGESLEARAVEALVDLPAALRGPVPSLVLRTGATLLDAGRSDGAVQAELVEAAGGFAFVARGLTGLAAWAGAPSVAVTGPGASTLLEVVGPLAGPVTVVGPPLARDQVWAALPALRAAEADDLPRCDLAVCALALRHRTDTEAVTLLTEAAAVADRLLVVEELRDDGLRGAAAAEQALLDLAVTGAPTRVDADVVRLAGAAGWALAARTSLGWGHDAFEFVRAQA